MDSFRAHVTNAANHFTMGLSLLFGCLLAAVVTMVLGAIPVAFACLVAGAVCAVFVARRGCHYRTVAVSTSRALDRLDDIDYATGLPNRNALMAFLDQQLANHDLEHDELLLIRLNLDSFGQVNDSVGVRIGDELIVAVARRLRGLVARTDLVARLNGDSFAIVAVLPQNRKGDVESLPTRLLKSFGQRFAYSTGTTSLSASIGYAVAKPGDDAVSLFRSAGWAEREAKRAGKNRVRSLDATFERRTRELVELEADLREAIAERRIGVRFQPQVDAEGHLLAYEALARWERSPGVFVRPDQFFAVAERLGLSSRLGEQVLNMACEILGRWQSDYGVADTVSVAVNFGANEIAAEDFVDMVRNAIERAEIRPENLIVEVSDANTRRAFEPILPALTALRSDGVNIALDNFGEGIFALNNLDLFPMNMVKIDRHLVTNVFVDDESRALFEYLVSIASEAVDVIVAEGVESEEQRQVVFEVGVDAAQGFHVAVPMDEGLVSQALPPKPQSPERATSEFIGFGRRVTPPDLP